MANDIRELYRLNVPEGGFNSSGVARQGKVCAVFQIDHTSYAAADTFPPAVFGMTSLDYIGVVPVVAGIAGTATYPSDVDKNQSAVYDFNAQTILYWTDEDTLIVDAQVAETRVLVYGTGATAPELL